MPIIASAFRRAGLRSAFLVVLPALALAAEPGRLSFPLTTTIPGNETVTVEVAWPVGDDGKPTADAQDICYYAPWWNEKSFAADHGGVFAHLAKSFTTVGIFFNDQESDQPTASFSPATSKSDDVVLAAIAQAREREKLPPLIPFATGHSSGASFIYQLMKAHTGIFGAVAPLSGMAPECAVLPQIPMLHVYTFGDDRVDSSLAWMAKDASWSTLLTPDPVWYARDSPIWLHINSDESITMLVAWLRGVADLRRAHGGVIPPMAEWPVAVPAEKVAATGEPASLLAAMPTRHFPNQDLADRFTGAHRVITHSTDAASGMQVVTVTPRAGFTRTVVVLIDAGRALELAQYEAVLVAGKGANAIAVQGGTDAALNALIAGITGPVAVIAPSSQAGRLASLPDAVTRVVLNPASPVAPGTLAVAANGPAQWTPDQRNLDMLEHACGLIALK